MLRFVDGVLELAAEVGWWIGFIFDLRVVLHWVSYLWDCWGICYFRSWWGMLSTELVEVVGGWL
jgi:hypothetical protein